MDRSTRRVNQHHITLNDPWFEHVKTGKKKYEGRCFWKSALDYNVGDCLTISHHTRKEEEPFCVEIKDILLFKSFEEALTTLGLESILPGVSTIEEGVKIYTSFVSLRSPKDFDCEAFKTQEAYGVCMLEVFRI